MKNPAFFKGTRKKKQYFEGWYFKCISADRRNAIALIPGMAVDPHGKKHSFIQVINAVTGKTQYHHFLYEEFSSPTDRFAVDIGKNHFDSDGFNVDVEADEYPPVKGSLRFSQVHKYPVSSLKPGIMGPFDFIPFMECYHAIIHLTHDISGQLELDGEVLDFDGGSGYIEKDYGRSFPQTYVWLQASHFEGHNASFVFSRARIPFLGKEFPGFFAYFTDFGDITLKFATYNRSKLTDWMVDSEKLTCSGVLSGPFGKLIFDAKMSGGGKLRAPLDGLMDREIIESITAVVRVKVLDRKERLIFDSISSEAGMEISL